MIDAGVPDLPRWVAAHGIAADPAGWRIALGRGAALGHDRAALIVVVGDADPDATAGLAREHTGHAIVCDEALAGALTAAGRAVARAVVHTLPAGAELAAPIGASPLPADAAVDPFGHLPAALAVELAAARATTTVWASYLDDEPACFAYAPWKSARWFDVSVETVPAARQLGLATITAAALIEAERAAGRDAVWTADDGNHASQRLAAALGFVACDALWVAAPA